MTHFEKKPGKAALPKTSRSLPISLIRAREKAMIPVREMLYDTKLTEQQWRVLRVLEEFGPVDATNLADKAGLLAPSVSRIVHTMVNNGHITRRDDPKDRRRQIISLAPEGKAILDAKKDHALSIVDVYRERLGNTDYEQLLDLLDKLIES